MSKGGTTVVLADGSEAMQVVNRGGAGGGGGGGSDVDLNPGTGTQSNVAASATAVTLLAANAARFGATIENDSASILYMILSSTTPTSTVYTKKMDPYSYYEVPAGYSGIIKGIWATATGSARVTEIT